MLRLVSLDMVISPSALLVSPQRPCEGKVGVIEQPSTLRPYIGALTVVGAYDRLVVNCVIGRFPERVGGRRGWPEVTARVAAGSSGPLQVALVLTAQLRWLCFGIHVTEHREQLRNYVAGLRSQLGVPPPSANLRVTEGDVVAFFQCSPLTL